MENNDLFTQNKSDRISSPEQLNRYIKVVTPGVGIVLVTMIVIAFGALCWGFYGSIPVTMDLTGAFVKSEKGVFDKFICVADVDAQAQMLSEGMEAQVSPGHAPRDDYGYIIGHISEVSKYPVSEDEILSLIGNIELTRLILPDEPGKLITIELENDVSAQNGLKWSHTNGGGVNIDEGTLASALIVLKEQRPIDLVLDGDS